MREARFGVLRNGVVCCVLVLGLLVSWACGTPGTAGTEQDTKERVSGSESSKKDAGSTTEKAKEQSPDSGTPQDQGGPQDQGSPSEQGNPPDQGEPQDQGRPQDRGAPQDNGTIDVGGNDRVLPDEPTTVPQPKPYSGGTCPTMKAGINKFKAGGIDREVTIFLPSTTKGARVIFMWHGLGDNPANFARAFRAAQISQQFNAIVIVPKGVSSPVFPKSVTQSQIALLKQFASAIFETWSFFGDPKADLALFDDTLSCLDKQFDIDNKRVFTTGFSAGALWSTYLTLNRSEYLAAALLFSGGSLEKSLDLSTIPFLGLKGVVKMVDIPYRVAARRIPVLMAWGGSGDIVSVANVAQFNFEKATLRLAAGLKRDKHFTVSCNHKGNHTVPQTAVTWGMDFLVKHEWGVASPYATQNLPSIYPSYCQK